MKLTKTKIDKIEKYTSKGLYKNQYTNINYSNMKAITDCNSVLFLYDVPNSFVENDKIEKSMNVYLDWVFNGYEKEYTDLYNIDIQDKNGRYTFDKKLINKIIGILGKCDIKLKMLWGYDKWYYYLQFENKNHEYAILMPQWVI